MTTTAAVQANRRNAKHSTGPRSEEGKARSSMNALKHGLTAGDVILPNEDPQAFQARLDGWHDEFPHVGALGGCLIELAAHASWRLLRCARYETARLAQRVRRAAGDFDLQEFARAESIGRRLLFEPVDRFAVPKVLDQATVDKLQRRHDDHPAILARQLQATGAGVRWLLDRWAELDEALDAHQLWHAADTYKAVRLLGRRPEDVLEDPVVGRIFLARKVADPWPWRFYDIAYEAAVGCDMKSVHVAQTNAMEKLAPPDPASALTNLRDLVAAERDRLQSMLPGLDVLDRLDRDGAEARAMFDPSEAGTLARRYETAASRELHKAIADLLKLEKQSDNPPPQNEPVPEPPGDRDVAPSDPAPVPAATPSRVSPRPRVRLAPSSRPEKTPESPPDPAL